MYKTVEQCQHYQRELGNGHFEIRVRSVCLSVSPLWKNNVNHELTI